MPTDRRTQRIFDTLLELRDIADGAEVATANETGIALDVININEYKAVINASVVDFTATETYVFDISVSDLIGGTYTKIATLPDVAFAGAGAGRYEIPLSGALADSLDDDAAFIRVGVTIAGTSPSITYGAYLTKI